MMAFGLLRFHPAKATVLALAVLALVALGVETRHAIRSDYRAHVLNIQASADRTAQQLAARTTQAFDQVSRSTLVINYVHHQRPPPSLAELELAGVIDKGIADPMFIADVTGYVQDSTVSSVTQYVADEEFFRLHRTSTDRDVHVGRAWVDPVTHVARVPVTRRLEVRGRFYGIVCAMVDPLLLTVPYGRHEASATTLGVLGEDGYYRSRLSGGQLTSGDRLDPAVVQQQITESRATLQPGRSKVDGTSRFASMVKVDGYPLYALVAVSSHEALAAYRHGRHQTIRWAVGTSAGILLAMAMLLLLARSLDQSRQRTRQAEATFRAALEGSLDAVFILDAVRASPKGPLVDLRVRDCNERAAQGLGTNRHGLLGASFAERLPASTARYLPAFERVMATGEPAQSEMASRDPGLEGVWLHHQIVPLEGGVALISRDITEKKANEAALAAQSRVDSLTGLANRRGFEEKLHEALQRSRRAALRDGASLALLYIDLDGFKAINDTHGHAVGDAVLVEVARRLRAAVRTTDVVARLGGDEFAVVAEQAGAPQDLEELAARIVQRLSEPHGAGDAAVIATPSVGIAVHHVDESAESLRQRADAAMYRAKGAGKARFAWAGRPTHDPWTGAGARAPHGGTAQGPSAPRSESSGMDP